jgi:hypothetical protein
MAKVTFSAGIAELRGNIGSVNYSRNRGGAIAKARLTRVKPWSDAQIAVRANRTGIYKGWWQSLTEDNRRNWRAFAAEQSHTDQLRQNKSWSGLNAFFHFNYWYYVFFTDFLYDPPADPTPFITPAVTVVSANVAAQELILDAERQALENEVVLMATTPPLSPGVNTPGERFRAVLSFEYPSALPHNYYDEYVAAYTTPTPGQKTFIQPYSTSYLNGSLGSKLLTVAIWT